MRGVYAVRERELRRKRNGEPWLRLSPRRRQRHRRGGLLGGRRGALRARRARHRRLRHRRLRDERALGGEDQARRAARGGAGRVRGRRNWRAESEVSLEQLESDLRELLATVQDPQLRDAARPLLRRGLARPGRASATRRRRRSTTRPTATGCSSTRSRSPRRSAPPPTSSPASTATSPSPARCCTTSARPRPTTTTRWRSTSPTPAACRARSRSATTLVRREIEEIPGFDPAPRPGASSTSSSATTARSSTAPRSSPPPARPSSST